MISRYHEALFSVLFLLLICVTACSPCEEGATADPGAAEWPVLTGEYLGQTPPGGEAQLFAPGLISTGLYTRDVAMTPDGKEFYFSVVLGSHDYFAIMVTKLIDGRWTEPQVAPFSGRYKDLEPAISPDGQKFFFFSYRPLEGGGEPREDSDLWAIDRIEDGWGEPYNLGPPVNSDRSEYFPSVTADGTLYFSRDGDNRSSDIYRSRLVDGRYSEPEKLGPQVNSTLSQFNSYVAPDESYLIFCTFGREDGLGGGDYFISFREASGKWSGAINMGSKVNSAGALEYSPYVSPDGKYFFFMAARNRFAEPLPNRARSLRDLLELHSQPRNGLPDIYWIEADFIETLRP